MPLCLRCGIVVVVVVVVVVVLTLTRRTKSVVTGQTPVTLNWKHAQEQNNKRNQSGGRIPVLTAPLFPPTIDTKAVSVRPPSPLYQGLLP